MTAPDFEKLANQGMPAGELAETFLLAYLGSNEPTYPINPFRMLRDMGVSFTFISCKGYEGVYLPAEDASDIPVVGINLKRPITRQRFTAAHELCHHLKDSHRAITCEINSKSPIERYAEKFAANLLMPTNELARQARARKPRGGLELDDVLYIAAFFGVSFQACLYRLAYDLRVVEGDISSATLKKRQKEFGPKKRRELLGLTDLPLYEQLFDATDDYLCLDFTPRVRQTFEAEYVYHDSRMEGIDITQEKASEIVVDLRLHGNESQYCEPENRDMIEVAGLSRAYDYVFERASREASDISVYDVKTINERLFSAAPNPEYGGRYRETNTLVLGAKFETVDARMVPSAMYSLDYDVQSLLAASSTMTLSEYVEGVLDVQHRMTVIHPFRDGNGRTSRAFTNLLLGVRRLPPVLFWSTQKSEYKDALGKADEGDPTDLYLVYFRQMLRAHALLLRSSVIP